ncbi:MAG TPA: tryptophan-rich sensory protein [Anaerolineae bacterium]|nr:tryptophan-rich sensory protein [Anaerolineae bacterium]HOQ99069.1 tryptophan-rich sensory protein [Anaerolineae bacterium]HPL28888.1 tryptophan-rich sensory protein [Anaerolineae bacterium]
MGLEARDTAPTGVRRPRYQWWHVAALGVAANLVSAAAFRPGQDAGWYAELELPPWAPPPWAFGPAWAINNVAELWGNLKLLNLPPDTPNRQTLLYLQGASWLLFSTYSWAAFRTRSPILSLSWTGSYWLLTIASATLSRTMDRSITLSFAPLLAWLTVATALSAYIAANNPDPFFGIPAQHGVRPSAR